MEIAHSKETTSRFYDEEFSYFDILSTCTALGAVANAFKTSPGIISINYELEDRNRFDYEELESLLAHPELWYEEVNFLEMCKNEECIRRFVLHDPSILEGFGYPAEEDALYVLLTTQRDKVIDVEVCCH